MEKGSTIYDSSGHITNRDDSIQDGVIDLSLSLGSSSKPSSSHGSDGMFGKDYGDFVMSDRFSPSDQSGVSTSSGTVSSGGSFDSRGKMVNFGTYVYNPHDRFPMPYSTSIYQSSCFSDTRCSGKESPKKTFIPSHTAIIKNIKEETEGKLNGLNNMGSLPPKISQPEAPTSLDDDDPDICILEDMSRPPPKKPCHVDEISGQWSTPSAPSQDGFDHVRFEKTDEQSVYQAVLQDLSQPTSEATPPDGALAVPLMKHQRIALSWMVQKETKSMHCVGGILADDQGLGKTISTIALILKERSPPSFKVGATEVKKEMAETLNLYDVDQEDVFKHDKSNIKVKNSIEDPVELAKYDVVLTTYAIVSMEVPIKPLTGEEYNQADDHNNFYQASYSSTKKRKLLKKVKKRAGKWLLDSSLRPLAKVRWFRVVLDEAQIIKNHRTKASRACWGLKAKRRWCLSGTPIQNAIDDLYSYFRVLRYDPYDEYATFCSTIKNPIEKSPARGYKKLQAILTTMLLRRTKATFIDGKPIISLPPKIVSMKKMDFMAEEREFYSALEENFRAQFQEYRDAGTVEQNYASILLMLLRLRQACGHPLLVTWSRSSSELESSLEEAKQLSPEKRKS
nr:helicase-like transcription factor CHR28 isoform X2 [Tanacetum cinerariifolium]